MDSKNSNDACDTADKLVSNANPENRNVLSDESNNHIEIHLTEVTNQERQMLEKADSHKLDTYEVSSQDLEKQQPQFFEVKERFLQLLKNTSAYKNKIRVTLLYFFFCVIELILGSILYKFMIINRGCHQNFSQVFVDTLIIRNVFSIFHDLIFLRNLLFLEKQFNQKFSEVYQQILLEKLTEFLNAVDNSEISQSEKKLSEIIRWLYPKTSMFGRNLFRIKIIQFFLSGYQVYNYLTLEGQSTCQLWRIIIMLQNLSILYIYSLIWLLLVLSSLVFLSAMLIIALYKYQQQRKRNQAQLQKIQNLTSHEYEAIKGDITNDSCQICYQEYYKDDQKVIQLGCNPQHNFHENCIKQWLKIKPNCPICRQEI